MKTIPGLLLAAILMSARGYAAQDVVSAIHGTIERVDAGAKTVVIKTDDGVEHTMHAVDQTAFHGADASADAAKDSGRGLTKGTDVVAHYTKRAAEDTAIEIDRVGRDGLKTAKGTVSAIDRGGKRLVVDTADGTKETFRLTDHATEDAGKDVAKATTKGSRVTVYYTEDAGRKVAHFFEVL